MVLVTLIRSVHTSIGSDVVDGRCSLTTSTSHEAWTATDNLTTDMAVYKHVNGNQSDICVSQTTRSFDTLFSEFDLLDDDDDDPNHGPRARFSPMSLVAACVVILLADDTSAGHGRYIRIMTPTSPSPSLSYLQVRELV
ncbi:hypothetical protein BDZ89DRAFT_1160649 [Hymenopellis radicata]|nr:hypothetical protein BDZ89DRAFT_1160649 [Hymenopellis radicata]